MRKIRTLTTLEKASIVLAIALILCFLPLPYGFYTIIRLATAVLAGCWAYRFYNRRKTSFAITAAAIALLFQPFLKISLDRFTWNVIDVILAGLIVLMVLKRK